MSKKRRSRDQAKDKQIILGQKKADKEELKAKKEQAMLAKPKQEAEAKKGSSGIV